MKVREKFAPGERPVSKLPPSAVTVCCIAPVLVHVTVLPFAIVIVRGEKESSAAEILMRAGLELVLDVLDVVGVDDVLPAPAVPVLAPSVTVTLARLLAPPCVVQSNWNVALDVMGEVAAAPVVLVLYALSAVKSA